MRVILFLDIGRLPCCSISLLAEQSSFICVLKTYGPFPIYGGFELLIEVESA